GGGLGPPYAFDPHLVFPDESRSLLNGAIAPWLRGDRKLVREAVTTLARTYGIDPDAPFNKLSKKHRALVLYGPAGAARLTKMTAKATAATTPADGEDDEEPEMPIAK